MGRLAGMRVYECGAMDRVPDGGVGWRRRITPWLHSRGVVVLDPSHKPTSLAVEEERERAIRRSWRLEGRFDLISAHMRPIRNTDLRLVDIADFLIFHLDVDVHACGSYEEVFLANREKKPCLVVCPQGKEMIPDWLFAALRWELFFDSFEEAFAYLDRIDKGLDIETYGRWLFLDQDALATPLPHAV